MGYIKCDKKHQKSVGGWMFTKAKDNLSSGQITKIAMMGMNNSSKLSSSISSIGKAWRPNFKIRFINEWKIKFQIN